MLTNYFKRVLSIRFVPVNHTPGFDYLNMKIDINWFPLKLSRAWFDLYATKFFSKIKTYPKN
jgi:hypothetical protein